MRRVVFAMVVVTPALAAQQQPAEPAPRAARLVLEHNGVPITDWLQLKPGDSLVLSIKPVDALGNPVPMSGFEMWVWDPKVLTLMSSSVLASEAVVQLQPRERGQTTIQIRAAGVRQWVLVHLTETVLAISPGQPAPGPGLGWRMWTAGGRADLTTYSFDFLGDTTFKGKLGYLVEGYAGLEWNTGLSVVGTVGLGQLRTDSVGRSVIVNLVEVAVRAQYAFSPQKQVRPVVELGGGMYRARSGTVRQGIWNASFFFLGGAGVDYSFTPKLVGEFRVGNRQQFEWTSSHANGHVASLFYFGAGVRARF